MQHDSEDKSRPKPTGLMKPVSWVLCLKILAIFLLWLCFFTPGKRLAQTPENVTAGLLGQPAAPVVSREERP